MNIKRNIIIASILIAAALSMLSSSCIFAPKEGERKVDDTVGKWQTPVAPDIVIENLKVAFNDRDIDLYERCLHVNYFYESISEIDSLNVSWSRSTDVSVMRNLFDDCLSFVFIPIQSSIIKEYGSGITDIPEGAQISDEHPNEIWRIYNYDISMDLSFRTHGEMRVHQFMKYAMVEDENGHYSIIRWIDETSLSE
ncbi:hypothetical protein ACFL50_01610 [Candidatus Latescibacterota bacterium]